MTLPFANDHAYFSAGVASDETHEDEDPTEVKQTPVSAFKTNLASRLKAEVQETSPCLQEGAEDKQFARWTTTWGQQFSVLLRRGVKERKHEAFSTIKIVQVLMVAFLSGLLWWQSDIINLQDQVTNVSLAHMFLYMLRYPHDITFEHHLPQWTMSISSFPDNSAS